MLRTATEVDHCPYCHHILNAASHVSKDISPKMGDLSICAYCNRMLKFNKELKLIKADAESRAAVNTEQLLMAKAYLKANKL